MLRRRVVTPCERSLLDTRGETGGLFRVLIALGIAGVLVVVIGGVIVAGFARSHAADDAPPPSRGADFVAPVSSGQYRFRTPDESPEEFKARIDRENAEIESQK